MGRRGGFLSRAIAKEVGRSIRQSARNSQRAAVQQHRLQVKMAKENAKLSRLNYLAMREQSAAEDNAELNLQIDELKALLPDAFSADYKISFNLLKVRESYPPLSLPAELKKNPLPPTLEAYLSAVKEPNWFARLLPSAKERYEKAIADASKQHEEAVAKYWKEEARKQEETERFTIKYEQERQQALSEARRRNEEVDDLETAYRNGKEEAIITYNTILLERSEYPDTFPQDFQLFYLPAQKQLNIEYELPPVNCIPSIGEYKYVKTRDAIDEKPRKQTEIKSLYPDIIASLALRTIYEVFNGDQSGQIQTVVFNGYAKGIDPATGKNARAALISVAAPKGQFDSLDLRRVDKQICLQNIGAVTSGRPTELIGITPLTSGGNPISIPSSKAPNISARRSLSNRRRRHTSSSANQNISAIAVAASGNSTSISNVPRQSLIKIVSQYGRAAVLDDHRLCRALLLDFCGAHRREIHVLVSVLDERIAAELIETSQTIPHNILIARRAKQLHDNLGIAENYAQWAVESWAMALGLIPVA